MKSKYHYEEYKWFQFLIVRLKLTLKDKRLIKQIMFQFLIVRLK